MFGKKKKPNNEVDTEDGELKSPGNIRELFRPSQTDSDSKLFFKSMLQSDKDNYVKARIPSAFNMTVHDIGSKWVTGDYETVSDYAEPRPERPADITFANAYRWNSAALGGLARDEAVKIAVGANPLFWMENTGKDKKLKEGDRK